MRKKGVTLIELVVAMAIFIIVVTLAVGAFVTVSKMKALTSTMKEAQQKVRIASEMITRLSRQADRIYVTDGGKGLEIYYNSYGNASNQYGYKFLVDADDLFLTECKGSPGLAGKKYNFGLAPCTTSDLSGGAITFTDSSNFAKTGTVPSKLDVNLYGKIGITNNPYYSNDFNIITAVILEGLK